MRCNKSRGTRFKDEDAILCAVFKSSVSYDTAKSVAMFPSSPPLSETGFGIPHRAYAERFRVDDKLVTAVLLCLLFVSLFRTSTFQEDLILSCFVHLLTV